MNDMEKIREALSFIPADDRDVWVKMAMAVKCELGEAGFDVWDQWGRQDESYKETSAREVWKSAKPNGGITGGSLFFAAKQYGWEGEAPVKTSLTQEQRKARQDELKRQAAEIAERHRQAALRAQRIYDNIDSNGAPESASYLLRKGIKPPDGVKYVAGLTSRAFGFASETEWTFRGLIVPMINAKKEIRSLQLIPDKPESKKLFLTGGQTSGCFHVLGMVRGSPRVLIAEGLATAQSLREATGLTVVVAFSAGNLPAVAEIIRGSAPTTDIIVCADDDEAGRKAARTAEASSAARVVLPGDGFKDFNDLHVAKGIDAVKAAVLGEDPKEDEEDDIDWRAGLIVKHKDDGTEVTACRVHNLILILSKSKEFRGRVRFNLFSEQVAVDGEDLDDVGPIKIKARLEKAWIKEKVPTGDVSEALAVVARQSEFHPIRDWLSSLTWDGIPRVESFCPDHLWTANDEYHSAVSRALFVSAVLRVFRPGCKVDTTTILEGAQGYGKSNLWATLFDPWYAEVVDSLNNKDFFSGLRGVWCADFGELDQFSRAEATRIKQVLTMRVDNYRNHYGRSHARHPRQCIFVGGTNSDSWQTDATGGRRFLPVRVANPIDIDKVAAVREQLFAEAVWIVQAGPGAWWKIPNAEEHQDRSYIGDPWEEPILEHLAQCAAPGGPGSTTIFDVLHDVLRIDKGKQTRADQMRASSVIKRAGWERKRHGRGWAYKPKGG